MHPCFLPKGCVQSPTPQRYLVIIVLRERRKESRLGGREGRKEGDWLIMKAAVIRVSPLR